MSKTCGEETSTVLLDKYTCSYKIVSVLEKEGTVILRDIWWGCPPIGELECITPCSLLREILQSY